jgi:SAM-dependent methyltransferase
VNRKIFNKLSEMIKQSPYLLLDKNTLSNAIVCEFDVVIEEISNDLVTLTQQVDEAVLEQYFSRVWQPETKKYKYSGLSIIDQVNAMNPSAVLDAGCGYNEFKGKIQNLTGIDPFNNRADINAHILDYETSIKYDVVICLGSINFGSVDKIFQEVEKVVSLTKPGGMIVFRVNPGIQHGARESKWIDFFEWDTAFILNTAHALNCRVQQLRTDTAQDKNQNLLNGERLYFVFEKQN